MNRLDDSTLEAIAEAICGAGEGAGGGYTAPGPYRRAGKNDHSLRAFVDELRAKLVAMRAALKPATTAKPRGENRQVFTLEVAIVSGPMSESFVRKHKVISRTIEIRGDQTLAHLHRAVFDAFDREDEHLYEFQIGGKRPMDPKARRYGPPMAMVDPFGDAEGSADAERTTLDSLGLEIGNVFGYWFDFGDDWWHQLAVLAIAERSPCGRLPKVTLRVGKSPPQYVDWEETKR